MTLPDASMPRLNVALALIWKDGQLLVSRRSQGAHLAGFWEFPGGKCGAEESAAACAEREALEEVGVVCRARAVRATLEHAYADRHVVLTPVDCAWESGEPRPLAVAEVRWLRPTELAGYTFPPANAPLLTVLARDGEPRLTVK